MLSVLVSHLECNLVEKVIIIIIFFLKGAMWFTCVVLFGRRAEIATVTRLRLRAVLYIDRRARVCGDHELVSLAAVGGRWNMGLSFSAGDNKESRTRRTGFACRFHGLVLGLGCNLASR